VRLPSRGVPKQELLQESCGLGIPMGSMMGLRGSEGERRGEGESGVRWLARL
jgi:hypothetical protein